MKNVLGFSIKTYMGFLLLVLALLGAVQQGFENVYLQIVLSVLICISLDFSIHYLKTRKAILPSSAFITGLIIALVLAPKSSWYVICAASIISIAQKHILRFKNKHVFNPANFGLLGTIFIFSVYPNWWGQSYWQLIILAGIFICYKMKRLLIPIVFISTFILILGLDSLVNKQPFLNALTLINIFFVFVMLIEPMTSPVTKRGQFIYAVLVALFSFAYFKLIPQYDFSILSLATVNILTSWLGRSIKKFY